MNHPKAFSDNALSVRDPRWQWINVRQVVDDVSESLTARLAAQGVETVADVPNQLSIMADRELLCDALSRLVTNALEAMPTGGRLVITSYVGPRGLELEVADSGWGLSDEARRRAFEPFFTTKSGGGGLGLAIVRRIANAHGGDVVAANCPEGGAAFTLRIPQRVCRSAA